MGIDIDSIWGQGSSIFGELCLYWCAWSVYIGSLFLLQRRQHFHSTPSNDLIKTGSVYLPKQSGVKGHFSHRYYIRKIKTYNYLQFFVHCHFLHCLDNDRMVWAVNGIKSGVLFDSNLLAKRIELLHLVPSFVHALTNQNDLKWSTNLNTSLIGKESSRSGLGAWCGFSLATRTPDTVLSIERLSRPFPHLG